MYTDDVFKIVGRLFIDSQVAVEKLQAEVIRLREKYEPVEEAPSKTEKVEAA